MTTSGDTQYDKIQQTHYNGCWADPKHHACAMREIEQLREEAIQLRQALGLLTTLHPTMEIDVNNPVQMALEIVSYVTESRDAEIERLREELKRAYSRIYKHPKTIFGSSGQTWQQAYEEQQAEIERLRGELADMDGARVLNANALRLAKEKIERLQQYYKELLKGETRND